MNPTQNPPHADGPLIACSLPAPELRARRAALESAFAGAITDVAELPDGYRLVFAPRAGLLETIARYVELETICCPFLSFMLTVPADHGEVSLAVTSAPAGQEFLRSVMLSLKGDARPSCCA